ncbi:MAG: hypothetical protein WC460_06830 [Patescibacteria group bacterium]
MEQQITEQIQQNNEIIKNEVCRCSPPRIGKIYIIIGHGKLHEKPYVRYVGQSIETYLVRYLKRNVTKAKKHCGVRPFLVWLKREIAGDNNIRIIPIAEMYEMDLNQQEILWIAYWRSIYPDLLNLTDGGSCGRGWKHSEETIIKIKKLYTEEKRNKIRIQMLGNKHSVGCVVSVDTRKKLKWKGLGRTESEETKKKIAIAGLGNKNTFGKMRGINNPQAKLTFNDVQIIRLKRLLGNTVKQLAVEYDVSIDLVHKIIQKKMRKTE